MPGPFALPALVHFTACLQQPCHFPVLPSQTSQGHAFVQRCCFQVNHLWFNFQPPDWIKSNCTTWLQHAVNRCKTDGCNDWVKKVVLLREAWQITSWNQKRLFYIFTGVVKAGVGLCGEFTQCSNARWTWDDHIPYELSRSNFPFIKNMFPSTNWSQLCSTDTLTQPCLSNLHSCPDVNEVKLLKCLMFSTHFRNSCCISIVRHLLPTLPVA